MTIEHKIEETVQGKETPMHDHPLSKEFPEGIPFWMLGMSNAKVRAFMKMRREAFPSTRRDA